MHHFPVGGGGGGGVVEYLNVSFFSPLRMHFYHNTRIDTDGVMIVE